MDNKQAVKIFYILGSKVRLNIATYLSSGEKCVCEIFKYLKLPQNLVSHHLMIMRKSMLIKGRREGKWIYYSLEKENIEKLKVFFKKNIRVKNQVKRKCP